MPRPQAHAHCGADWPSWPPRDQGPDGLSVTDIARLTGIQRPTIYRLLAALLDAGLVLPVTGTKKYRAQLAVDPDTRSRDPRVRQLLPVLRRLADRTGDAVFLVVRDEDDSISLHREIGSYPVQILATYAGKRQPLGVGSGGMALLAALPDEVARGIVERNSGRLDEYGGMTPQEMYRLIENTRARGYSVVGNHAVRGALGVGCWTRMARRCWPSASPRSSTACRRSASARSPAGSRPSWQGWRRRPSRRGPFDGATAPSNAVRRTLGLEPDLAPASALEQLIQHLEEFPLGRLVRLAQRIQEGGGLRQRYFLAQVAMDEGHVHPAIRQSGPAHVDEMQLFARVHEHIAVAQVAVREHRVLARQRRPQPLQQVLGRGQVRPGFQVVVPVAQVIGQQVFQLAQARPRPPGTDNPPPAPRAAGAAPRRTVRAPAARRPRARSAVRRARRG